MYSEEYWKNWMRRFGSMDVTAPHQVIEEEKKWNFIERMTHLSSGRILDCGCAFGSLVYHMRNHGWVAWGIDVSEFALGKAPLSILPFLKFASVTEIPFETDMFDVVVAFDVLEHVHVTDILKAVPEMVRVSKKWIVVKLPVDGCKGEQGIPDRTWDTSDDTHISIYSWEFWARRFDQAGAGFVHCSLWDGSKEVPSRRCECMEAWMLLEKRGAVGWTGGV